MLGMDFTSLCWLSIQTHIIASLGNKINPLFEFFSHYPGTAPPAFREDPVKTCFFAQRNRHGKNPTTRKKCGFCEIPFIVLCEPKMNIHKSPPLWKTLVDKTVENVENCELSTGIPPFWFSTPSCGNPAYGFAYECRLFAKRRVTSPAGMPGFFPKNLPKVYNS